MRFLCDEMLRGLCRYLRAAGHDAALVPHGLRDRAVVDRALAEGRVLLTCDRELADNPRLKGAAVRLRPAGTGDAARQVTAALDVDWLHRPFSRCLVDNAPLRPASDAERAALPARVRHAAMPEEAINACPDCGRLYWPGSHVRRMRRRLQALQAGR